MAYKEHKAGQIKLLDESERIYLESLIRPDYERSHPDETLDDLKRRARFSKEDKGLLRDWMMLAARRTTVSHKPIMPFNIAA